MNKVTNLKFAVLGVIVITLCGAGVAFAVSGRDSGGDIPGDPGIPIVIEESPSAAVANEISRFSTLEKPTDETIANLSEDERQWIRFGLSHVEGAKTASVSSIGTEHTKRGNDVIAFTASDQICVYSTKNQELLNGTCAPLKQARSGGVYVTGEYGRGPEFYVVGLVPDDVDLVQANPQSVGTLELTGNIYEGVVSPENFTVEGESESGTVVARTSIPLKMFAGG